jgi:hypothetical protein
LADVHAVLAAVVSGVAALVAALGLASTVAGRRIGLLHLAGTAVLELVLLVQAVLAGSALAGGHHVAETATFLAYLAAVVVLPVAGAFWARSEPTRWAGSVLTVAAVVTAVMVWRLVQLWGPAGA